MLTYGTASARSLQSIHVTNNVFGPCCAWTYSRTNYAKVLESSITFHLYIILNFETQQKSASEAEKEADMKYEDNDRGEMLCSI
jgi:hypothetical protein